MGTDFSPFSPTLRNIYYPTPYLPLHAPITTTTTPSKAARHPIRPPMVAVTPHNPTAQQWSSSSDPGTANDETFIDCLANRLPFSDPIVTPGTELFRTASQPYNTRFRGAVIPLAIAYPSSPSSIALALSCAAAHHHPAVARSGGRSPGAYSLGGAILSSTASGATPAEGSLVLDLRGFKTLKYDATTQEVTVGSGVMIGEMTEFLEKVGRAVPSGVEPMDGVGGQVLMGGFGYTSRAWGLLLDNLVAVDAVLASGKPIRATVKQNKDLFWALAGAGPSFAISHTFTLRTHPLPDQIVHFDLSLLPRDLPNNQKAITRAARLFSTFQAFGATEEAIATLAMSWEVRPIEFRDDPGNTGTKVAIVGQFVESREKGRSFRDVIGRLQDAIIASGETETKLDSKRYTYMESMRNLGGAEWTRMADRGPWNINDHANFYTKSMISKRDIPRSDIKVNLASVFKLAEEGVPRHLDYYIRSPYLGGPQSVVVKSNPKGVEAGRTTSFGQRDLRIVWELHAKHKEDPVPQHLDNQGYLVNFVNTRLAVGLGEREGVYPAEVDPELSAIVYPSLVYGKNYMRLAKMKEKWDPYNLFRYPQSIKPNRFIVAPVIPKPQLGPPGTHSAYGSAAPTVIAVSALVALVLIYRRWYAIKIHYLRWQRKGGGKKRLSPKPEVALVLLCIPALWLFFTSLPYGLEQSLTSNIPTASALVVSTPQNATHPLQLLSLASATLLEATPLKLSNPLSSKTFLTNLSKHPRIPSLVYATDEQSEGRLDIITIDPVGQSAALVDHSRTGGKEPAYVLATNEGWAVSANFDGDSIGVHMMKPNGKFVTNEAQVISFNSTKGSSHPHQIIRHPSLQHMLYVPDMGSNCVRTIKVNRLLGRLEWLDKHDFGVTESYGTGPRHGVFSVGGSHLFLGMQHTSTVVSIPVDGSGDLLPIISPQLSTLTPGQDASSFALSAMALSLSGRWLYVANRRVVSPYPPLRPDTGDTIAVFEVVPDLAAKSLKLRDAGRIPTGCRQPREMLTLRMPTKKDYNHTWDKGSPEHLAVSCLGAEGEGSGVVLFKLSDVDGSGTVVKSWQGPSSWGIVAI